MTLYYIMNLWFRSPRSVSQLKVGLILPIARISFSFFLIQIWFFYWSYMCIFDLINLLPSARCTYVDRRAICIKTLSSIVNLNDKQKYCIQYVQCVSMNSKIAVTNRTHSCVNMYVCNRKLHYILHIILNTSTLHWNICRLLRNVELTMIYR